MTIVNSITPIFRCHNDKAEKDTEKKENERKSKNITKMNVLMHSSSFFMTVYTKNHSSVLFAIVYS